MGDQEVKAELTIVMAVYGQPLMLCKQMQAIGNYHEAVRQRLNVVIVDDCGDPPVDVNDMPALAFRVKSAKLLRVQTDIHWNQMGGRNLGAEVSSGHLLFIDPDMVFDGDTMRRMIEAASKLPRKHVVKWGLRHVNSGKLDMTSPNTWLIHREDFFAVGGYDEDFAGHKGWSDVQFLNIMHACFKVEKRPDLVADFHSADSVADAMVTSLDRSTATNKKLHIMKIGQAKAAGGWAKWAKTRNAPRLRFPWQQLYPTA